MDRREPQIHQRNPEQELQKLAKESGTELEVISGVPVFTVKMENKDTAIPRLIDSFGDQTVLRIINSHFVRDAVESGTDRVHIDEHDFRSVIYYITGHGYGHDMWDVEGTARDRGLTAADAFCGTPYESFKRQRQEGYSSLGLGIPDDRSAILIFDGDQLQKIKDSDGYLFTDPSNKKTALLGVIKLQEQLFEFERALHATQSTDEQVTLLENEITQNMSSTDDLRKAFYIALNIVTLLRDESVKNARESSAESESRLQRLKDLVERLKLETQRIVMVRDHKVSIDIVQKWIEKQKAQATQPETEQSFFDKLRARKMPKRPDEIIASINESLSDTELPEKYKTQLQEVLADAQKLKEEMQEITTNSVVGVQKETRERLDERLEE